MLITVTVPCCPLMGLITFTVAHTSMDSFICIVTFYASETACTIRASHYVLVAVTTHPQLLCNGSNKSLTVVSDVFNYSSMHVHVIGMIIIYTM